MCVLIFCARFSLFPKKKNITQLSKYIWRLKGAKLPPKNFFPKSAKLCLDGCKYVEERIFLFFSFFFFSSACGHCTLSMRRGGKKVEMHNCGDTTETITLLQQFIKKKASITNSRTIYQGRTTESATIPGYFLNPGKKLQNL